MNVAGACVCLSEKAASARVVQCLLPAGRGSVCPFMYAAAMFIVFNCPPPPEFIVRGYVAAKHNPNRPRLPMPLNIRPLSVRLSTTRYGLALVVCPFSSPRQARRSSRRLYSCRGEAFCSEPVMALLISPPSCLSPLHV